MARLLDRIKNVFTDEMLTIYESAEMQHCAADSAIRDFGSALKAYHPYPDLADSIDAMLDDCYSPTYLESLSKYTGKC